MPQLIIVSLTASANSYISPFSSYAQRTISTVVPDGKKILALSILETPDNTYDGVIAVSGGLIYLHANKVGKYNIGILVG